MRAVGPRLVIALWISLAAAARGAAPAAATEAARARAVQSVGMTVSDLDRSLDFYSRVLEFEKTFEVEVAGAGHERLSGVFGVRARVARMRLGAEEIELTEYLAPRGRPVPVEMRANDRAFQHIAIITSDMDRAYRELRRHRVEHASSGPQRLPDWNAAAGGIRAFYFRDPDGHYLEVLQFPPGKGDPRWQRSGDRLFLGIDHTAIVVEDTERSLAFYRGALGMRVAGESENHGTEQEHLNGVFGARLRITALRAAAGPGVEILEYLAPRDGRPAPADLRSNDLAHWQTRMVVGSAQAAAAAVAPTGGRLVSPGVIEPEDKAIGFARAVLLRDPDGHAVELVEERSVISNETDRISREN
jgi:catechol 2,3-dioxygenase-like lactoylglutathione lyase family enzyme